METEAQVQGFWLVLSILGNIAFGIGLLGLLLWWLWQRGKAGAAGATVATQEAASQTEVAPATASHPSGAPGAASTPQTSMFDMIRICFVWKVSFFGPPMPTIQPKTQPWTLGGLGRAKLCVMFFIAHRMVLSHSHIMSYLYHSDHCHESSFEILQCKTHQSSNDQEIKK